MICAAATATHVQCSVQRLYTATTRSLLLMRDGGDLEAVRKSAVRDVAVIAPATVRFVPACSFTKRMNESFCRAPSYLRRQHTGHPRYDGRALRLVRTRSIAKSITRG